MEENDGLELLGRMLGGFAIVQHLAVRVHNPNLNVNSLSYNILDIIRARKLLTASCSTN